MVEKIIEKVKPQFKIVEIDEETKVLALKLADEAMNKSSDLLTATSLILIRYIIIQDIANYIKSKFEEQGKGSNWHVIVGTLITQVETLEPL